MPKMKRQRNLAVFQMWCAGERPAYIADACGISRPRVHQIMKRFGSRNARHYHAGPGRPPRRSNRGPTWLTG
jgi:hypothetical protein